MLATSEEILSAWLSPARQLAVRVKVDQSSYGSEDVTSLSFDSGSISGEVYQIGSTYMNTVQIVFPSIIETIKEDQEVIPELGILVDGEYHYSKLGHFFITEFNRDRNAKTTTITASDKMIYMEGVYESKLTYSKPYREVALEIANLAGVEINQASFASLGTLAIKKPVGYTHRQAIGLIAQFEGGFASFNRDGELEVRRLRPTDFEVTPESYLLKGFTKNENAYRIGGITVRIGEEETDVLRVGSTNGSQIELENKVMTRELLNKIWDLVKNLNYFPFELKWRGSPVLEAGDWMYVTDRDGNRYSVPNLSYSLTFNGGLSGESKATTNSSSQATYKYRGSLKQKVDWLDSILSANNWNSNYYDATEPSAPKEGDAWFKPNGQDIEIWVYEKDAEGNLDWVFKISTATDPALIALIEENKRLVEEAQAAAEDAQKAGDDAQKAADEAKGLADQAGVDAGQALDKANDAVSKANDATQKVGGLETAVGLVTEQSANAVDVANQAKGNADTALGKADSAIGTAQDALNQSALAKSQAEEAIEKYLGMGMVPAWSWSLDGTDRFTTVEPGKNLFVINDWEKLPARPYPDYISQLEIQLEPNTGYVMSTNIPNWADNTTCDLFVFSSGETPNSSLNGVALNKPRKVTTLDDGIVIVACRTQEFSSGAMWAKLEIGNTPTIYTPAPEDDYPNAVPSYIGFAIEPSDNPADYTWIRNPEKVEGEVKVELTDINGELKRKVSQETFDQLNGTVINHSTLISQNQHDIGLKANKDTVDVLNQTVTDNSTAINVNAEAITQKASQTSVNALTGRVTEAEGSITTIAGQVALKANQSTVDTLNNTVNSLNSELTVQAGKISGLTTVTDGHTTKIGALELQAGQFSLSLSSVQNDLNGLEIGGRNYFSVNAWKNRPSFNVNNMPAIKITLKPNVEYVMSTNIPTWADNTTCDLFVFDSNGTPSSNTTGVALNKPRKITTLEDGIVIVAMRNREFNTGTWWAMLSKGNKALDWTPAPEDMATVTALTTVQAAVDGLAITVANKANQSQVTQLANQITSVVSDVSAIDKTLNWQKLTTGQNLNTMTTTGRYFVASGGNTNAPVNADRWYYLTVDNTSGRIKQEYQDDYDVTGKFFRMSNNNGGTWLPWQRVANQSQITQLTDAINLRVIKNDIINQININDQGVLIAGEKVHITGLTTIDDAVIKTANIVDLNVTEAKLGNLSVSTAKIADAAITSAKIGTAAIGTAHIGDGVITNAKIGNLAVSGAKIQDATISSAKIINLDASKITANTLSAITTDTGALNVSGWLTMTTENRGIMGSYDFGDAYGQAFNYRWFVGDYRISHRHMVFAGKAYKVTTSDTRGSYLYDVQAFYGNDYVKLRQYNSAGTLLNRIDINSDAITMGAGDWGTASNIVINSDGTSYFNGRGRFSGLDVSSPNGLGLRVQYIDAPEGLNYLAFNHNQALTDAVFSIDNIYFNQNRTGSADFRIGKDGSTINGGRVVSSSAVYNRTYSGTANMIVLDTGTIGRTTSARKYKADIQPAYDVIAHAKKVMELNPSSWYDKGELADGVAKERYYGFIADEFAEVGLNEVVVYRDGEIESLAYDRIPMYHNVILSEHEKEIQELKAKVQQLENEIRVLQAA